MQFNSNVRQYQHKNEKEKKNPEEKEKIKPGERGSLIRSCSLPPILPVLNREHFTVHQVYIQYFARLQQSSQVPIHPFAGLTRIIKELDCAIMLNPQLAEVEHTVLNIFLSQPLPYIIERAPFPLSLC